MKGRPISNPANRFHKQEVDYLGDPPDASIEIREDHTRRILSENDSPDVGFRWSVNPYRGCIHACAYCLDPETPILLANGRTRRIADLRIGDDILGTVVEGKRRRFVPTKVLAQWSTQRVAYR